MMVMAGAMYLRLHDDGPVHALGTQLLPSDRGYWVAMCGARISTRDKTAMLCDPTVHHVDCAGCKAAIETLRLATLPRREQEGV